MSSGGGAEPAPGWQLVDLRRRPDWVPLLARWHQREWPNKRSYASRIASFGQHLGPDPLPTTLVLVADTRPTGCVSLLRYRASSALTYSFWLANVYVIAEQRGRGFGRLLVQSMEDWARCRQLAQLHLYTFNKSAFYRHLGWEFSREKTVEGDLAQVMTRVLKSTAGV